MTSTFLDRLDPAARSALLGAGHLCSSTAGAAVHRDGEPGRAVLVIKSGLVMVRLRNATREPDGSFRQSWLRVPPEIQTAHEAVAWTFGMTAGEYAPQVET